MEQTPPDSITPLRTTAQHKIFCRDLIINWTKRESSSLCFFIDKNRAILCLFSWSEFQLSLIGNVWFLQRQISWQSDTEQSFVVCRTTSWRWNLGLFFPRFLAMTRLFFVTWRGENDRWVDVVWTGGSGLLQHPRMVRDVIPDETGDKVVTVVVTLEIQAAKCQTDGRKQIVSLIMPSPLAPKSFSNHADFSVKRGFCP